MTHLHILAFFVLAGYGEMQSAGALGLAGIIGIGARPSFGILSDRLGREIVFTIAMSITFFAIVVVILFTDGGNFWALMLFVVLSGLSDGLSGLILGAKAADMYRPDVLGRVMGMVDVGRGIGLATGGIFTGVMFDVFGNYALAYWVASAMALLSIVAVWGVKLVEGKQ
jgi:MFS family permease